ncbi:hypothetical protein HPB51_002089 [Rhipicephalus microplus]|uniref:DDE Tnp4 domain-containing protein n=1 Tax=Rhipicephalus microplus TaxID=6941 RepID=A0A9J6E5L6_RHIMP|nr:hypothetical protein HPB51_002089 [Rhipicephalus microplus]
MRISRVLNFLDSISAQKISWSDHDEKERNKSSFLKYVRRGTGLPDIVGTIDECHVRIARPAESEQSYYKRKKFYSIILQSQGVLHNMARRCGDTVEGLEVCNSRTDVSSAEPAEDNDAPTHSSAAFRNSIAHSVL